MSFSEKADIQSVVAELELANKLDDGSSILVFVFQVARKVVIPVVLNINTELVDIKLL